MKLFSVSPTVIAIGLMVLVDIKWVSANPSTASDDAKISQLKAQLAGIIKQDNVAAFLDLLPSLTPSSPQSVLLLEDNNTLLHLASIHGSKKILTEMLSTSKNLTNLANAKGETPLHLASLNGHVEIVRLLLDESIDNERLAEMLETKHPVTNWTALLYAVASKVAGATQVTAELLSRNADLTAEDANGMQPGHIAVINNRLDIFALLLRQPGKLSLLDAPCCGSLVGKTVSHLAAEYNIKDFDVNDFNASAIDALGQTPSCWAASNGSLEFARKTSSKFDPKEGGCVGNVKPLHVAIKYKRYDYAKFLIENTKVSLVDVKDSNGNTPLHTLILAAVLEGKEILTEADRDFYQFLSEKEIKLLKAKEQNGRTPFLIAVQHSALEMAKLLWLDGADVAATDMNGFYALHIAKHSKLVDFLRQAHSLFADMDVRSNSTESLTPLQVAILDKKPIKFINFLINQHVNLTAVDGQLGRTPAHCAVLVGYEEVVDELLEKADDKLFSIRDKAGRTPLLLAVELGQSEIVRKIVVENPNFWLEKVSASEDSGLHVAAKHNRPEIFCSLLSKSQQKEQFALSKNINGETALHTAASYGHVKVVRQFLAEISSNETLAEETVLTHDKNDRTVVHSLASACSQANTLEIAKLLATHLRKAENLVDVFGETPLETAVRRNCVDLVALFLEAEMPCTVTNKREGYSPIHVAKRLGLNVMVSAMVATGKCQLEQLDNSNRSVREIDPRKAEETYEQRLKHMEESLSSLSFLINQQAVRLKEDFKNQIRDLNIDAKIATSKSAALSEADMTCMRRIRTCINNCYVQYPPLY